MREIKFRVWSTAINRMADHDDLFNWFPALQSTEDNSFTLNKNFPDHCVLMQYTGLKDKDGTDIYEGDILRWNTETGQVVWLDGDAGFDTDPVLNGLNSSFCKYYEVIGNVYQNPDLMEGK